MNSKKASDKSRHVDILSFDGGGSRGIMELSILSDVMRLATIVWQDPEKLSYLTENRVNFSCPEIRNQLVTDLAMVCTPLHPTEIYDMIVGTSTGALIAFGLVGGKENKSNGERLPMTVQECIDMYLERTKEIFSKSLFHWIITHLPGFRSIPLATFPKDNVEKALEQQFGKSRLADFKRSENITSVAGAVARQIGQKEELVLFDTSTEAYKFYKTHRVLLASSNAPVYFDTPVRIGNKEFVDGGVGGNCPLAQAIPRAKEIFPKHCKITSALSIAPPTPKESQIPHRFQIKYWLNYFVNQSTNGYAVYKDAERRYKNEINFQRLSPRGESLKDFQLDEVDVTKMLQATDDEKLNNEMFLVDVIATASVVVDTYVGKATKSPEVTTVKMGAQLAQKAGDIYADKSEYELAYNSYNTSKRLWKKVMNEDTNEDTKIVIAEIDDNIAKCFEKLGKYQEAIKLYRISVDNWKQYSCSELGSPKIAKALHNLAKCLMLSYNYDEAEEKFELALKMQRRMWGESMANAEVAHVLDDIGWCKQEEGKLTEAVRFYLDALAMKRELYSTNDHLEIAETLNNLGLCLLALGKNDEAIKHVQDSFGMRKRLIETQEDYLIAESLNNIGYCLTESEEFTKALDNLKKANTMFQNLSHGNDHLLVAISSENLAKCLCNVNQGNRALELVEQALYIKKACLGEVNPGIAKTLSITGLVFEKTGDFHEAENFYLESMRMTKVVLGPTHPNLVQILSCLGESLVKQNKIQEAKIYFEEAKDIQHERPNLTAIVERHLEKCIKHLYSTAIQN